MLLLCFVKIDVLSFLINWWLGRDYLIIKLLILYHGLSILFHTTAEIVLLSMDMVIYISVASDWTFVALCRGIMQSFKFS